MFRTNIAQKIITHLMFNKVYFFNRNVFLGNVEKFYRARQDTDDSIMWRMSFACCITKAKNAHTEYASLIVFPLQKWLHKRV